MCRLYVLLSLSAPLCLVAAGAKAEVFWPQNGNYYELVDTQVYGYDARTLAAARSYLGVAGHLVTFASAEENDFVTQFVLPQDRNIEAWIGGYKDGTGWHWVTGEPWSYQNWATGKPNNWYGNEDCLYVYGKNNMGYTPGTWDDYPSSRTGFAGLPYVVEYPTAVPEPSSLAMLLGLLIAGASPGVLLRRRS